MNYPREIVRLRDVVTIHKEVGGYSGGYCLQGTNDIFVYRHPNRMFFSISHNEVFDKYYGVDNLVCSFAPKLINANYLALLLNSDIMKILFVEKLNINKRMSLGTIFSSIQLPNEEYDVQNAVGFLEIICQFLEKNSEEKLYTIEYLSLKLGLFNELAEAIADEILMDEQVHLFNLNFIEPWLDIYKSISLVEYTKGVDMILSDVAMLQCTDIAFDKLTGARSELYSNLMRYRIVRIQK